MPRTLSLNQENDDSTSLSFPPLVNLTISFLQADSLPDTVSTVFCCPQLNPGGVNFLPIVEEADPLKTEKLKEKIPSAKDSVKEDAASTKTRSFPTTDEEPGTSKFLFLVLIFLLVVAMIKVQPLIAGPLAPGDILALGAYRSKCGFLNFVPAAILIKASEVGEVYFPDIAIPEPCELGAVEMGEDGVLRGYEDGTFGTPAWELKGEVCKVDNEECNQGLLVDEDGSLWIGDKAIKITKKMAPLTPWPFVLQPVNAKRKR